MPDRDLPFPQKSNVMREHELSAITRSPTQMLDDLLGDDATAALRSIRWLRRLLDGAEDHWVRRAWRSGESWMWIGLMLGRSRQAVHMRYRRAVEREEDADLEARAAFETAQPWVDPCPDWRARAMKLLRDPDG